MDIADIHTLTIEKKEDGYFAIVLGDNAKVISGYLLKEEEG
jgi:hypothetical protein